MDCSNVESPIVPNCRYVRPMSLDERRQLMERQKWINNVMRILNMPRWEAENTWVRIKVSNYNEELHKTGRIPSF